MYSSWSIVQSLGSVWRVKSVKKSLFLYIYIHWNGIKSHWVFSNSGFDPLHSYVYLKNDEGKFLMKQETHT